MKQENFISTQELNKAKKQQLTLVLISVLLLVVGAFLSIHTDGLGVVFGVVFPFSFFILIVLIISLVKGIKGRAINPQWYIYTIAILACGLFFWSPLQRSTRDFIELQVRWSTRERVVADIKSGTLSVENGKFAVPFDAYGRVSFNDSYIGNTASDNVVQVVRSETLGLTVSFTTNGGFLANRSLLLYVEKPETFINAQNQKNQIRPHWFRGEQSIVSF